MFGNRLQGEQCGGAGLAASRLHRTWHTVCVGPEHSVLPHDDLWAGLCLACLPDEENLNATAVMTLCHKSPKLWGGQTAVPSASPVLSGMCLRWFTIRYVEAFGLDG